MVGDGETNFNYVCDSQSQCQNKVFCPRPILWRLCHSVGFCSGSFLFPTGLEAVSIPTVPISMGSICSAKAQGGQMKASPGPNRMALITA